MTKSTTNLDLRESSAWRGVWTALITPLNADLSLDTAGVERLIEDQIAGGVRGLVIAGSTGEGSLLRADVYEALLAKARAVAGQRIPLVAGLGIGGTDACLANLELARKYRYDAVLASPPAYVKAPQRGLATHFLKIAEAGLPVCLYEVPSRAASSIDVSTIVAMIKSGSRAADHIVALKDASANLERPAELKARLGTRLALLTGDDPTYAAFTASGGSGVISVVSHFVPREMNAILEAVGRGDCDAAVGLQGHLMPLIRHLFTESNPIPTKTLAARLGWIREAHFSPPLCPLRDDLIAELRDCYNRVHGSTR